MTTDPIQILEEKLAFLEASVDQLGDEIFRQQKEITALKNSQRELQERLNQLEDLMDRREIPTEEKPPHY